MKTALPLLGAICLALPAAAEPTDLVLYQHGRLLDANDQPVAGTVSLTVRLYKSSEGGVSDEAWKESYDVTLANGVYALALGDTQHDSKKPLKATDVAGDRWVSVEIGGKELSPRLKLGTMPRAALADLATKALDSDKLGGVEAAKYALKTDLSTDAATLQGKAAADFLAAGATALDSAKLGGVAASAYALKTDLSTNALTLQGHPATDFLAATAQATDSAKLGGHPASDFLGASAQATDSAKLSGHPASDFLGATAQATDAAKLGGHVPSDFVLAADNHPVLGVERLVLNFEEGGSNSTPVLDSSGGANNGTLSSGGLARVTSGHNGTGAVQFLAGGGLLTIPNADALNITNGITLEAWVNVTGYPASGSQGVILMKDNQYGLRIAPNGSLQAYFATALPGSKTWVGATNPLPIGTTSAPQWVHVAATYDGLSVNLYVNGALSSMTPAANGPLAVSTSALTVGGLTTSATTSFSGIIDEVRIASVAKTFRTPPAYMKLAMSDYQSSLSNGTVVNFNSVHANSRMTSSANGINLKAGHTYRMEAILNLYAPSANQYLGYAFWNGSAQVGDGCYTGFGAGAAAAYAFHAGCLEIYTPTSDVTVQIRVFDANTQTITPAYNTYFMVTELQ